MEKIANYIDGELVAPTSGQYLENIEPATGQPYSLIPDSDDTDIANAVAAAKRAWPQWRALSVEQRAQYMENLARAIEDNLTELARAESIDNGKPLALAKSVDIPRAVANFRFFSHAITQFASESHAMGQTAINYTLRDPIGVVGCISPWNLPLYLFTWKIAPALAAGNCVVAKPSEMTPMSAFMLSKLCQQAGLPNGVLNIVHGLGAKAGDSLVAHPKVKAISFTGGTVTGKRIASVAAPMFKKLSLELGGKNPALVFADCDFDKTLNMLSRAAFANQGQICLCPSRIYVEKPIYEAFRDGFVARATALNIADPLEDNAQQGAVVSKAHMEKILGYIELAQTEGGKLLCGGSRKVLSGRCEQGYFIEPTVIEGLGIDTRTNQEEIFGPVITIAPFEDQAQAIALANGTDYGLAATVWSQDVSRCHQVAGELDFGIVWLNTWLLRDLRTPFGGVKHSGVGREGGVEALKFFTEAKNVCLAF